MNNFFLNFLSFMKKKAFLGTCIKHRFFTIFFIEIFNIKAILLYGCEGQQCESCANFHMHSSMLTLWFRSTSDFFVFCLLRSSLCTIVVGWDFVWFFFEFSLLNFVPRFALLRITWRELSCEVTSEYSSKVGHFTFHLHYYNEVFYLL